MIESDKLNKDDLQRISDHFKISICLIARDISKKYQHDIIITHHRNIEEEIMLVFYQTENILIHIKKKEGEFQIKDLPEKI